MREVIVGIIANREATNSTMVATEAPKRMNVDPVFHADARECLIPFLNACMSVRTTDGRIFIDSFPVRVGASDEERAICKDNAIRSVEVIHVSTDKGRTKFLTSEDLTSTGSVIAIKDVCREVSS